MKDLEFRLSARFLRRLSVAALIGAFMIPTAVIAAGGAFTDDDTSVFEANIEWLAESGVTKGCNPPENTRFCPDDNVTRGQMAAFMQRFAQYLGAEDGTPAQADNASTADNADNADTLGGYDSAAFVSSGVVNRYAEATVADGLSGSAQVSCLEGEVMLGGGAALSAFVSDVNLLSSRPSTEGGEIPVDGTAANTWRASATNPAGGTGAIDVRVWAMCAGAGNPAMTSAESGTDGP